MMSDLGCPESEDDTSVEDRWFKISKYDNNPLYAKQNTAYQTALDRFGCAVLGIDYATGRRLSQMTNSMATPPLLTKRQSTFLHLLTSRRISHSSSHPFA